MDLGEGSVSSLLRRWEQDPVYDLRASFHGHTAFVRHMVCSAVAKGHSGCVNRLALNQDATLLLSGSDDCNLRIWRIEAANQLKLQAVISPGHFANIFGVAFMPHTNDAYVASAGLDRQVRHTHVETSRSTLWSCHEKMVKTITAVDSHTFISASKDATARLFDVRCPNRPTDSEDANVVVKNHRRHYDGLNSAIMSPQSCHHLLVASNDSYLRVFDLRFSISNRMGMNQKTNNSQTSIGHIIEQYCPPHLHETSPEQCVPFSGMRNNYATYSTFSDDAKQIVASYYDDAVHVFDRSKNTPSVSCRSPFMNRASHQTAIYFITQEAASVLLLNFPTMAIGRANRILQMDPENFVALLYKADGLMRRERPGDFRTAYATLERLIQLIRNDRRRIVLLWGHEYPCGPLCFPKELNTWEEKADVWIHVFMYMQAVALYKMIPTFQFSMLLRPHSTDRMFTKKRLDHLNAVCSKLEAFQDKRLRVVKTSNCAFKEVVRLKALGYEEEHDRLYMNKNATTRGKILSTLVDRFTSGIDMLRERLSDRMSLLLPHHNGSDFPYAGTNSEPEGSDESLKVEEEEEGTKGEEEEEEMEILKGDDDSEITDINSMLTASQDSDWLWGPNISSESIVRSFHGHISQQTDIKEASFYGSKNQVVLSGSDDGQVYMWCAKTAELLCRVQADDQIVNCVIGHPHHSLVLSSGIDYTIKMITPQERNIYLH